MPLADFALLPHALFVLQFELFFRMADIKKQIAAGANLKSVDTKEKKDASAPAIDRT